MRPTADKSWVSRPSLQSRADTVEQLAEFVADVKAGRTPDPEALMRLADAISAWLDRGQELEHALGFKCRRGGRDETAPAIYRKGVAAGAVVMLEGNSDIRRSPDVAALFGNTWKER